MLINSLVLVTVLLCDLNTLKHGQTFASVIHTAESVYN